MKRIFPASRLKRAEKTVTDEKTREAEEAAGIVRKERKIPRRTAKRKREKTAERRIRIETAGIAEITGARMAARVKTEIKTRSPDKTAVIVTDPTDASRARVSKAATGNKGERCGAGCDGAFERRRKAG